MMVSGSVAGRERVVIVDRDLDFGLKVADHLASSGYHAVLARSLDSMLDDLSEMRPGAILLSDETPAETGGTKTETLRTVKALCPHAPVITFIKPPKDGSTAFRSCSVARSTTTDWSGSSRISGVEEVLRAKLGIPFARVL